jgi:3-deoxy-manno-octulosonate cytidylyltransferase (CMP-KDO synthetase)
MTFHVVIPARHASERLPGKPLAMLGGKPMIQWVYERAGESGAASVTVATDDQRVLDACAGFGAQAMLTADSHQSGTDRVAEVAERKGWCGDDIVVNLQGDEPLMPPSLVAETARTLVGSDVGIATLAAPIVEREEWTSPDAVKVVCDRNGRALYFSRASIPFVRASSSGHSSGKEPGVMGLRHIGLYAYRVEILRTLTGSPPCALETSERLEQLRALWLGIPIAVLVVDQAPPAGVDTPDDLARVERFLS